MNRRRNWTFPRLLIGTRIDRPPVDNWRGTKPNQAAIPRPDLNIRPLPTAATVAVAIIGPMPGTVMAFLQSSHCAAWRVRRAVSSAISVSRANHGDLTRTSSPCIRRLSNSPALLSNSGSCRAKRVGPTPTTKPCSSNSARIWLMTAVRSPRDGLRPL